VNYLPFVNHESSIARPSLSSPEMLAAVKRLKEQSQATSHMTSQQQTS
jgi:hypothetical protein